MKPWAYAEERAAKALGGRRVRRERFESAPDLEGIDGWTPEVKYRARLPRLVVQALRQAAAYAILGARPVAILFERGSREGIACLRLDDFALLIRNESGQTPDKEDPMNEDPHG